MGKEKTGKKTKEEKYIAFLQRAAAWNPNIRKKLEKIQEEQKAIPAKAVDIDNG